jgi:hypothetical protein
VGSSSSGEVAKKEDLKQATDQEIADIKEKMDPEELKEMEALLGDLSPECGAAFVLLETEEDTNPADFMNSECFGELKEGNRPDGLTETCNKAYDDAFSVMQTNVAAMESCDDAFKDMPEGEEPSGDMLIKVGECQKVMEDIESSAKIAEDCDESIILPWGDMGDDKGDHCDMNNDGMLDEKEKMECGEHKGPDCDMNNDGQVDQTEKEQCFQEGPGCDANKDGKVDPFEKENCEEVMPDCDFNKDGNVDEAEGLKCMEDLMKGMCDMDKDGTVTEAEQMECDKMTEDSTPFEAQEMK